MMKFFITLILFLTNNCYSQQLLVRIAMESFSKVGYGVEMFFVIKNADEFKRGILKITKFTEREILNAFEYPLVEPGFSYGMCEQPDTVNKRNADFIQKYRSATIEKNDLRVTISVSLSFLEYCVFELPIKYWGSYDVNFKKAAVITGYRKMARKRISRTSLSEIESLFNLIPD